MPWGTISWLGLRTTPFPWDFTSSRQKQEPWQEVTNAGEACGNKQPVATEGQVTVTNLSSCTLDRGMLETWWPFLLSAPPCPKTASDFPSPPPKDPTALNPALCCWNKGRAFAFCLLMRIQHPKKKHGSEAEFAGRGHSFYQAN